MGCVVCFANERRLLEIETKAHIVRFSWYSCYFTQNRSQRALNLSNKFEFDA